MNKQEAIAILARYRTQLMSDLYDPHEGAPAINIDPAWESYEERRIITAKNLLEGEDLVEEVERLETKKRGTWFL